jgi:hypothetical protein
MAFSSRPLHAREGALDERTAPTTVQVRVEDFEPGRRDTMPGEIIP